MNTAQTTRSGVEIDPARFPRMFTRLRQGGLYRHCDCAGDCDCQGAARRLLRQVVQRGQDLGALRATRSGSRYRVFEYPVRDRSVKVVADLRDGPVVMDAHVTPSVAQAGDGETEQEVDVGALLTRRLPSAVPQHIRAKVQSFQPPPGTPQLVLMRSIATVPSKPGLYVLQWSGGQYLGKADNLRKRLTQHQAAMRRLGLNPMHYQMYVGVTAADPRPMERAILQALAQLAGGSDKFRRLGMTNQQTELEWWG